MGSLFMRRLFRTGPLQCSVHSTHPGRERFSVSFFRSFVRKPSKSDLWTVPNAKRNLQSLPRVVNTFPIFAARCGILLFLRVGVVEHFWCRTRKWNLQSLQRSIQNEHFSRSQREVELSVPSQCLSH